MIKTLLIHWDCKNMIYHLTTEQCFEITSGTHEQILKYLIRFFKIKKPDDFYIHFNHPSIKELILDKLHKTLHLRSL